MYTQWIKIAVFGFCLCLVAPSLATSLRCKGQLVWVGDYRTTVLKKCGFPSDELIYPELFNANAGGGYYVGDSYFINEWIYDRSSNNAIYTVRFKQGRVESVEMEGAYGGKDR